MISGVLNIVFRRCALRVLARELPPDAVRRIWAGTSELQLELRRTRPRHSLGVNLLLRYFEWDAALYGALQKAGVSSYDAGRMIEEINWMAVGPATGIGFSLSRLRSRHLHVRVKWIVDLMFAALFTAPFRRTTYTSKDEVAFDVTACPLAEYFKAQGVPELTRHAACSLDHRMARNWRVTLQRTQTIADDQPICDFRFLPRPQQPDSEAP
jgi:hypothetical protein